MCVCIYIYIERERERERESAKKTIKDHNNKNTAFCLCVLAGKLDRPLAEILSALKKGHWDERKTHPYTEKYSLFSDMTKK